MSKKKKTLKELTINDFLCVIPDTYVRETMLAKDYKKFIKWMSGQTVTGIGGETVYYIDDVRRFLKGLPVID